MRLIVSPSGNWYGSEQVLFDFLRSTRTRYVIFAPQNSAFIELLKRKKLNHNLKGYRSISGLYTKIIFNIVFNQAKLLYLNEAGHIRYIVLLSKLFSKVRYVVHVRLLEDTIGSRWPASLPPNLKVVVISEFIQQALSTPSILIYDPYEFRDVPPVISNNPRGMLIVGVIGRISQSKGVKLLIRLIELINQQNIQTKIKFNVYGDFSEDAVHLKGILSSFPNVALMGFIAERDAIYGNIDCVLHCAGTEPLGRVFLEAIDYYIPVVGLNSGGIGEIGRLTGLLSLLIDAENDIECDAVLLKNRLVELARNFPYYQNEVTAGRKEASEIFSLEKYRRSLECLFVNES